MHDWTFESVSSDGIRRVQMEEHMKKGCTKDEAFKNTQRTAVTSYNETKNRLINQSTKVSAKTGPVHIIFLDKNHPNRQAVQSVVKDI